MGGYVVFRTEVPLPSLLNGVPCFQYFSYLIIDPSLLGLDVKRGLS